MTRMSRTSRLVYLALPAILATFVLALGGISALRKVSSFQPLGFTSDWQQIPIAVGEVLDPETGLRSGDLILGPGATSNELRRLVISAPFTELQVLRGDELAVVRYKRPGLAIDFLFLLLAASGVLYVVIGFYTVARHRQRHGLLFFLWCLSSAVIALFTVVSSRLDGIDRILVISEELARTALPALTLHLFLVFPSAILGPKRRRLLPLVYLPSAVLGLLRADLMFFGGRLLSKGLTHQALLSLDRAWGALFLVATVGAVAVLLLRLRRVADREEHFRLRWMSFGLAAGLLPFALTSKLPSLLSISVPSWLAAAGAVPLVLVPFTFAYVILRYKLWDVDAIVRSVIASTLTLFVGVVGFALIDLYLDEAVPERLAQARTVLSFAAGVVIAGLLVPTRRAIGGSLERLQFGAMVIRRRELAELGRELLQERDLDALCAVLLDRLVQGLDLADANLYVAQGAVFVAVRPRAGVPAQLPADVLVDGEWERDVTAISGLAAPDGGAQPLLALYRSEYRYVFPLTVRGHRVGFLVAAYKLGDVPLTSEDVELMRAVLNQAALALENAQLVDRLHQQLEEMIRLQRYSEGIIESSPAGLAVLDSAGTVLSANLAFAALVGRERRSILGAPVSSLLSVRVPSSSDGMVDASDLDGHGKTRYLQLSTAELENEERGQRLLMVHDVTERVSIERELKEKDRLASLGMLAAGVAHEVNTPITGISSYAQMLLEETPEDDPRHALLKKVERQTFRAARIVSSLLEFARDRRGEQRPVSIARLLGEVAEEVSERCRERGIAVRWEPPSQELLVLGSDTELAQVFVNLLANAIDAMKGGGALALAVGASEAKVWASITDSGPGIPPDQIEKIFQPFFSTKLSEGGTGLGLSISYEIVRRHGGEMRVESQPGRGCTFFVELPRLGNRGGLAA